MWNVFSSTTEKKLERKWNSVGKCWLRHTYFPTHWGEFGACNDEAQSHDYCSQSIDTLALRRGHFSFFIDCIYLFQRDGKGRGDPEGEL